MPKKPKHYYCWVIAYINTDNLSNVKKELKASPEYAEVEAYIPTVKILKKQFKGKSTFEEIPLLFNYGFFKIPRKFAISHQYLENMKDNISCIFGWVKDPAKKFQMFIAGKHDPKDDKHIYYATATSKEITDLIKIAFENDIHKSKDLTQVKPGEIITLRGYPFEGIQAELVSLDAKRKRATVKIEMFESKREVEVSFDNLFFTIYHNKAYDDSVSTTEAFSNVENTNKFN